MAATKLPEEGVLNTVSCYSCHHIWSFEPPMGRRDECPSCHRDSRVCLNCSYYDKGAHRQCREPQAELVSEKTQGNFCGYFRAMARNIAGSSDEQAASRKNLEELFGQSKGEEKAGISSLDELFKK